MLIQLPQGYEPCALPMRHAGRVLCVVCCSTSFDVVVVSMQYIFMAQGDFNFPAGQWKTPIGAKNVIGYGVAKCGELRKIENRKLLMVLEGSRIAKMPIHVKKVLVCKMLIIVQLFKLLYVILLPLIFD